MKYYLHDTEGKRLYKYHFSSWSQADSARNLMGRPDWSIHKTYN